MEYIELLTRVLAEVQGCANACGEAGPCAAMIEDLRDCIRQRVEEAKQLKDGGFFDGV